LRSYCVISSGFGFLVHCMCNRCCFWFGNVKYLATQRLLLGSKLFFFVCVWSMKCCVIQGIFVMWRSMQGRYLTESVAKFRRWPLGIEWTVHRLAKKTEEGRLLVKEKATANAVCFVRRNIRWYWRWIRNNSTKTFKTVITGNVRHRHLYTEPQNSFVWDLQIYNLAEQPGKRLWYYCNWFCEAVSSGEGDPLLTSFTVEVCFSLNLNTQNNRLWSVDKIR
jgi:hypothetical protein